jgi:hypothetical protein
VALAGRPAALARIAAVLAGTGADFEPAELIAHVQRHGRVTLNFHPDRIAGDGRNVVTGLLEDGRYRSQFETLISSGSRTAYAGGIRDQWEEQIFGRAYQAPGVTVAERPKYGGLNLLHHSDGASPRFGSCHLRLRPEVLLRCTFCFGDSHVGPSDIGTVDAFEPVFAALLQTAAETGNALGIAGMHTLSLVETLLRRQEVAVSATVDPGRALDDYIEAQVHGDVDLASDVEAIVVDPSFRDTQTGAVLAQLTTRYDLALEWHAGFELTVDDVSADFRGPAIPRLAARIHREFASSGSPIDAALIGLAAASLLTEPERWQDWGTPDETLQHLKQLWHVLVRFGTPRPA